MPADAEARSTAHTGQERTVVGQVIEPLPGTTMRARVQRLSAEHHDFLLLLLLSACMHFMALMFLDQNAYLGAGPAHDYWFYYAFAELSNHGQYPFVQYWLEYPPVFAWLVIGVYKLSLFIPPIRSYIVPFYLLLSGTAMLADIGILIMIYLIARKVYGARGGFRAAMIYALLLLPLWVALGWYDTIPTFLLLLPLYLLLSGHPRLSALIGGIGFMMKLMPALVVPVAVRSLWRWRDRLVYVGIWAIVVGAIAAPFLWLNAPMLIASFRSALVRSSWETIWALLEGYNNVGIIAPLGSRFIPDTAEFSGHPSTLPWLWITLAFGVVGGAVYLRRLDLRQPLRVFALTTFTVMLFFLYSKGYSPQFAVYVLPFIVILLPNLYGIVLALLFTLSNFLTLPLYEMLYTQQTWTLWLAVILRTAVMAVVALESLSLLVGPIGVYLQKCKTFLAKPAAVGVALLIVVSSIALFRAYVDQGDYYVLKRFIDPLSTASQAIVTTSRESFENAHAQLPGADHYFVSEDWASRMSEMGQDLRQLAQTHSQVWVIFDGANGDDGRFGFVESILDKYGAQATNSWFDSFRLINMVSPQGASESVLKRTPLNARFGDQLELQDFGLTAESVPTGQPVRIAMTWRVLRPIDRDLSLFIHMVAPSDRVWDQVDKPLMVNGARTSGWAAGDVIEEVANLPVLSGTPPVDYRLILGVYDPITGKRLPLSGAPGGPNWLDLVTLHAQRGPLVVAKKFPVTPPGEFEEGLRLLGVDMAREIKIGQPVRASVFWQSPNGRAPDLVAYYRILDRQGRVVSSSSGVPGDTSYPTSQWTAGEVIRDRLQFSLPADVRPGDYRLHVDVGYAGDAAGTIESRYREVWNFTLQASTSP